MLSLSILDLLPEAVEEIGFVAANTCFYLGVLFFAAVVALVPEPDILLAEESSRASKSAVVNGIKPHLSAEVKHSRPDTATGYATSAAYPASSASAAVRGRPALSRSTSCG